MTAVISVKLDPNAGPVTVHAGIDAFPIPMAANLWQYTSNQVFERKAGAYKTGTTDQIVGQPAEVTTRIFLLEGMALTLGTGTTDPYSVVVAVEQGTQVLYRGVPTDGGSGQISDADIPFTFHFTLT